MGGRYLVDGAVESSEAFKSSSLAGRRTGILYCYLREYVYTSYKLKDLLAPLLLPFKCDTCDGVTIILHHHFYVSSFQDTLLNVFYVLAKFLHRLECTVNTNFFSSTYRQYELLELPMWCFIRAIFERQDRSDLPFK